VRIKREKAMKNPREFIIQKFTEYYRDNANKIPLPTSYKKREFGFILSDKGIMLRHKAFSEPRFFRDFIKLITPSDVYHSAAYYKHPSREMGKKEWIGADLIFDIDFDHISTPCTEEHEYWTCELCDQAGVGKQPSVCSQCGGSKFKMVVWLCETCLETAKSEALKLIEFLVNDFGFLPQDVEVCFSGHRGYHIHVERDEIKQLDQDARKEIVDYVQGTGLKVSLHGLMQVSRKTGQKIIGPDLNDPGWSGKIARGVYDIIVTYNLQQLKEINGINKNIASLIFSQREKILKAWNTGTPWGSIKGVGIKTWEKLVETSVVNQAVSIDTVVTIDIHRLIRMPLTLHGKTGLKVVSIPSKSLERFDPLRDAVAFNEGTLKVYILAAHRFRIGKEIYGPYERETVKLPMAAAIYLLCKRAALLTD
jgi:DNA primase small subunit